MPADVFASLDREVGARLEEATGDAPAEEATVSALVAIALELRALRLAVLESGERPQRVRWWW